MAEEILDHEKPLKTFRVTTPHRGDVIVHAHGCEFAGEMNSTLWFYNHVPGYSTELVCAFSKVAWTEVAPVETDGQKA